MDKYTFKNYNREQLGVILDAFQTCNNDFCKDIGYKIVEFYTQRGLPIDMALNTLHNLTKEDKTLIVYYIGEALIEHKVRSNAGEKAIDKQRRQNAKTLGRFLSTGETMIY